MGRQIFNIGFFQFAPKFGEVEGNLSKVETRLAGVDADIIVLPELAFTGYRFRDRQELTSLAEETAESSTVARLAGLCRKNGFHIVTGFAEKSGDRIYNSALLIGGAGVLHTYRKLHLFNTEKAVFDPGDTKLKVIDVSGVRIGMMVCFDWVFPEVARILSLKGADLLCHPSNLVLAYCQRAMRTRCLENSVYAVTANRYGTEEQFGNPLTFTGQSQVVSPKGDLIYRADAEAEELRIRDIDVRIARNKQITDNNHLIEDRRTAYYTDLCQPL